MSQKRSFPCGTATAVLPQTEESDVGLILGRFTEFLRNQGYAEFTIRRYQFALLRVEKRLASRGVRMTSLTRTDVPALLREVLGPRGSQTMTIQSLRKALRRWLRFNGTFDRPPPSEKWIPLVEAFDRFLLEHRGAAPTTRGLCRHFLYDYLAWQFGDRELDWASVRPADLWRYGADFSRRFKPTTVKRGLCALRSFFRFLHLHGDCTPSLEPAVPSIPNHGPAYNPGLLSRAQRRRLLAECRKHRTDGLRDYAMVLCMIDLGLRRGEVTNLRLTDFDAVRGILAVPAIKSERRQLPIPAHVSAALNDYLRHQRPHSSAESIFLRHDRRRGQPVTAWLLGSFIQRVYRRCGFPLTWTGTHRLRHTFATRLFGRGAGLKELADVLGHRRLQTSRIYTHLDLDGLRLLARPWPL
jgi:integrase/recombinase XerD